MQAGPKTERVKICNGCVFYKQIGKSKHMGCRHPEVVEKEPIVFDRILDDKIVYVASRKREVTVTPEFCPYLK